MPYDDRATWALAVALVTKYRLDAFQEAERRAKAALDAGDTMGHGIWLSVADTVFELIRPASDQDAVN